MDLNDPNFFKLNYLCVSKLGQMTNQRVIIEKNIRKSRKIQRVKSGTTPNNMTMPKFNKINNTKTLNDKKSPKARQTLNRTKSNNKKIFNDIYQSYYSENNRIKTIFKYPISVSPTTPGNNENKKKNNFHSYHEISCKTNNNKKYSFIDNNSNKNRKNISSGNIFNNNNYIPLTESKNNYFNIKNNIHILAQIFFSE